MPAIPVPFHEAVVLALRGGSRGEKKGVLLVLRMTKIPKDHDLIVETIAKYCIRPYGIAIAGAKRAIEHVLAEQKRVEAERIAKENMNVGSALDHAPVP